MVHPREFYQDTHHETHITSIYKLLVCSQRSSSIHRRDNDPGEAFTSRFWAVSNVLIPLAQETCLAVWDFLILFSAAFCAPSNSAPKGWGTLHGRLDGCPKGGSRVRKGNRTAAASAELSWQCLGYTPIFTDFPLYYTIPRAPKKYAEEAQKELKLDNAAFHQQSCRIQFLCFFVRVQL